MAITKPTKPNTFSTGIAMSADVNENFDVLYAKTDELIDGVNAAAGSNLTLADRMNVSTNADGTLKTGITAGGEWINAAFAILYVSATSFTAGGNQTSIFTATRRLKVTLAASTVYSAVVSANYSAISGLTTVVIADAVLTNPITSVEHSNVSPLASSGSVSPAMIGAATAAQGALADAALPATSYTAADVLVKLLTVDVDNSGLNATTLQGAAPATTATADKIAKRDGAGKLAGDILGNAETATKFASGTHLLNHARQTNATRATYATVIPYDTTPPTVTEGTEIFTASVTAEQATSVLNITGVVNMLSDAAPGNAVVSVFLDSTNIGTFLSPITSPGQTGMFTVPFHAIATPGDTNAHTVSVRIGSLSSGSVQFNGIASTNYFGGAYKSTLTIDEIVLYA